MATALKTIEFWFPDGTNAADNSDTNLTQITVYIPESSPVFKSVVLDVVFHDRNTTIGNVARRQLSLQLGAAGYTAVNNVNTWTNRGEQQTLCVQADFTAHFTTNWTGASMTCDARVLFDCSTASPLNPSFVNISARLAITYEYDATSATHIKTIRIPLDHPVTYPGTSKPGTANATIPDLDADLPESSKVYRQLVLVCQGNTNGATTDMTYNMQVDTDTAFASYAYEHGSNCGMWVRMNSIEAFDTSTTHGFYIWNNANYCHHQQCWLVVTYEFDATDDTVGCWNSVIVPIDFSSGPAGGTTNASYQRGITNLWIEEPTTITTRQVASYLFWTANLVADDIYARLGTGDFIAYDEQCGVFAGANGLMVRHDDAYTLARGINTLVNDVYVSVLNNVTTAAFRLCGYMLINYTSGYPVGGHGTENHTVEWWLCGGEYGSGATPGWFYSIANLTALAITIPETSYFINSVGVGTYEGTIGSDVLLNSLWSIGVERLAGEGGIRWERVCNEMTSDDSETGIQIQHSNNASHIFKRWPSDIGVNGLLQDRLDIETSRRWRCCIANSMFGPIAPYVYVTYHSQLFEIAGTISGSGSGTVNLTLFRDDNNEAVLSTSRAGDGSYSFTWYDDVDDMYVAAYEDNTHVGRSLTGVGT